MSPLSKHTKFRFERWKGKGGGAEARQLPNPVTLCGHVLHDDSVFYLVPLPSVSARAGCHGYLPLSSEETQPDCQVGFPIVHFRGVNYLITLMRHDDAH